MLRLFYSTFAHAHKSSAPAITACTDERAEIVLDLETFVKLARRSVYCCEFLDSFCIQSVHWTSVLLICLSCTLYLSHSSLLYKVSVLSIFYLIFIYCCFKFEIFNNKLHVFQC